MISRSFLKSSVIFTAGGALPMLGSFILLPFYTNFLTDHNYTRLLFYISVSAIAQVLFSCATDSYFGIRYSQLYAEPTRQKSFVRTVSLLLLVIGTVLLVLTALFGPALFRAVFEASLQMDFWPYGFVSILTGFFNAYFKTASICLIYVNRPGRFFFYNVINFVLTIGVSLAGLYLYPGSLAGPIVGRLVSGAVIFVCGFAVFRGEGDGRADRSFLPELAAFCVPYLVYGVSIWILSGVDRYFLKSHVEIETLNYYDLVLKCFIGIEFLQNSILAVVYPRVYDIWARAGENATTTESNRYFNVFTILNIAQLLVFCIVLPWLYDVLIQKQYFHLGVHYLGVLAAGYATRSIVSYYLAGVLFTKSTVLMLRIFLVSAVIQIALSWLLVRSYGIAGAIYAGLAIRILQAVFFAVASPRVFTFRFNAFKILILPVLFIVANVIPFAMQAGYSLAYFLVQLLVFSVVTALIFRNEIRKVYVDVIGSRLR